MVGQVTLLSTLANVEFILVYSVIVMGVGLELGSTCKRLDPRTHTHSPNCLKYNTSKKKKLFQVKYIQYNALFQNNYC